LRTLYFRKLVLFLLAVSLTACAGGISDQARSKVTYFGTFSQLQQQPDNHLQKRVMWGGKVIETRPLEAATELVVLQLELNGQDRPKDDDLSQGRYVARSKGFLDPAIYPKGTLITVVGRFVETDQRMIGELNYQYPVIEIDEIKKWPPSDRQSPRFRFGFGVGTHF
jgi:outer membrane lipoprotein